MCHRPKKVNGPQLKRPEVNVSILTRRLATERLWFSVAQGAVDQSLLSEIEALQLWSRRCHGRLSSSQFTLSEPITSPSGRQ